MPRHPAPDPTTPLPPNLSLRQVEYFVTVARIGTFTETAARLCVTQPALSAAILQMEKQLGTPLFDRSSHPVALTEAGAAVLPLAEHLLNTARSSLADMAGCLAARAQTVRIGLIPSAATRLLPALARFRAARGALRADLVDLPNEDLLGAVERGELDFGIGAAPATGTALELHRLWEDEFVLVLPAGDPLGARPAVSWEALAERELAVFRRGDTHHQVMATLAGLGLPLQPAYQVAYVEPLLGLVRHGMALAILPRLYTEHLHDPGLAVRTLEAPRVKRWIVLVRTHHPPRHPLAGECFEALRQALVSPMDLVTAHPSTVASIRQ